MLQVYWRNSKLKFKIFAELHQIEKHAACRYAYKMKMLTNFCRNHIFSTEIQLKLCYPIGTIFSDYSTHQQLWSGNYYVSS